MNDPGIVRNLRVEVDDGTAIVYFDAVEDADGYIISFYRADEPYRCIKRRYADKPGKTIRGFVNGTEYLASVCAFFTDEDDREVQGGDSDKVSFVPCTEKFKATEKICLRAGETAKIEYDYQGTKPEVVFQSTNPDIARVDESGNVIALAKGEAYIVTAMDEERFALTSISVDRGMSDSRVNSACIAFTGDLMCAVRHQKISAQRSFDFNPEMRMIRERLSIADARVGVLETMTDDSHPYEFETGRLPNGAPNCNSPSAYVKALAGAGFDVLITANNHNCDTGIDGLKTTINHIRHYGMTNSGTFFDNPVYISVKGIRVALISLCMIYNGLENEVDDSPEHRNLGRYSEDLVNELIFTARSDKADYIVVFMHWGTMNSHMINDGQRKAAQYIADAGADLIVGSHPHLIQKSEYITTKDGREVLCAYSLGNFQTSMNELAGNRDSVALILRLHKDLHKTDGRCSYIPFTNTIRSNVLSTIPLDIPSGSDQRKIRNRIDSAFGNVVPLDRPVVRCIGSEILTDIMSFDRHCETDSTHIGRSMAGYLDYVRERDESRADYCLVDVYNDAADESFDPAAVLPGFVDYLLERYGHDRIILVRLSFDNHCISRDQLRNGPDRSAFNDRLKFIEQVFIELAGPVVIDVAGYYFRDMSHPSVVMRFEPHFYLDAHNRFESIMKGSKYTYHFEPDHSIWMKRVLKYYDNMQERGYWNWLVTGDIAGRIIIQTSHIFVAEYAYDIAHISSLGITDAADISDHPEISAEITDALKIIDTVEKGRLLEDSRLEAMMFDYGFNICSSYAHILSDMLDYPVSTAEIPYASRFKDDREKYLRLYAHKKANVDIWGSCISRTSVARNEDIVVANYIFKQPALLAFNDPMDIELPEDISNYEFNTWRKGTIRGSVTHNGISRLNERGTSWIVVDLYDLITECARVGEDYLELDDFIKRTLFYKDRLGKAEHTYLFDEIYDDDADEQFGRFADYLKDKYGKNIILIRVDCKDEYIDLDGNMARLKEDPQLEDKRAYIAHFEDMLIEKTGCHVIDIARDYKASDAFPLGGAHIVHYESAFYDECCRQLGKILGL